MPSWWPYFCWTLNAVQIGIVCWQVRLTRQMHRNLRETQQRRDQVAINLAESERLLRAIHLAPFGLPAGEDGEASTAH